MTERNAPRPRRVLLGVTGGVAAYKSAALTSKLVQAGVEVRIAMTEAAQRFVGPVTFQSLSGRPAVTSIWAPDDHPDSPHIGLARWCDLMLIAPCTANCLAKLAAGLTDDPVTLPASALPAETPLLVAPAMNADMWARPIVRRNLDTLHELLPRFATVGPDAGWQACRTDGSGRMAEPQDLFDAVQATLAADPDPS
ncbi:MAG: flavoprotein [Planctomycetota bacterium]